MIYISAQPDEYYFLWQLKLQLFNFEKIGIAKGAIHVLIGFDKEKGLNSYFSNFIKSNNQALFYVYEDTRKHKLYPSSIRPHLLKKHLRRFPELENVCLFYHDSDILFHTRPELSLVEKDDIWYASDTRNYLDCNYVIKNSSKRIFEEMCNIIGVSPDIVVKNTNNAGGAQYLLKGTSYEFWDKIETDCEKLYTFLKKNIILSGIHKKGYNKSCSLDIWITDMWVLWWNALLYGHKFQILRDLEFCWVTSDIADWNKCNILHYTGSEELTNSSLFIKTKYKYSPPFYDDFSFVDQYSCSKIVVDWINAYRQHLNEKRGKFTDFILIIKLPDKIVKKQIKTLYEYLTKEIDIEIIFASAGEVQYDKIFLDHDLIHYNEKDDLRQVLSNYTDKTCAIIWPCNIILDINDFMAIVKLAREIKGKDIVCCGFKWKLDALTQYVFSRLLEFDFLLQNKGKLRCNTTQNVDDIWVLRLREPDKNKLFYKCDYYIL